MLATGPGKELAGHTVMGPLPHWRSRWLDKARSRSSRTPLRSSNDRAGISRESGAKSSIMGSVALHTKLVER